MNEAMLAWFAGFASGVVISIAVYNFFSGLRER